MGREVVGPCTLSFSSPVAQSLLVSWGEHLTDGHVSRIIGARDFSFDYHAKAGENSFTNYLLRLGCRYLEIDCEEPIDLHCASIIPQVYPVGDKPAKLQSAENAGPAGQADAGGCNGPRPCPVAEKRHH